MRQDERARSVSALDEARLGADPPGEYIGQPADKGYSRYLAAKTSVDDRALNRHVLAELYRSIRTGAPRVIEVGAGLGTMVARLLGWGIIDAGEYTLVDVDAQLLHDSRQWLQRWAGAKGIRTELLPDGVRVGETRVHLVQAELADYLVSGKGHGDDHAHSADVLIASAVLDLVDVPAVLPGLLRLLDRDGVYWFTINYDGESVFAPDHPQDKLIMLAYHRDMDERVRYGRPAGDSRSGRHLFHHLRAAGAPPLCAGSSDWVVHAEPSGSYPHDEAYFLECILQTIQDALRDRVEPAELAGWLDARRQQLRAGELIYMAHQLDFVGRAPNPG